MKALLDVQLYRDLADDSGLSEPDYDALSTLTEVPSRSWRAAELAERLLWSRSRLSHHIGRMERRGLVRREQCEADARGAMITLTRAGMKTLTAAAPGHVESVRRNFIDVLSAGELKALAEMADKVLANLGEKR